MLNPLDYFIKMSTLKNNFKIPDDVKCFVDRTDILDDLIIDNAMTAKKSQTRIVQQGYRPAHTIDVGQIDSLSMIRQREIAKQNADLVKTLERKQLEKSLKDKANKSDKRFSWLLNDLEKSKEVLDTVDKSLDLFTETQRNKKRHQFEDWNQNVHAPIQQKIAQQVDSIDTKTLNKRKNDDYNKFLDITNRKAAIFLDIIIESEYDPLEPNLHAIKTNTMRLKDATHVSQQKAEEENSMLGPDSAKDALPQNTSGKRVPIPYSSKSKTKDMLSVELWNAGKIEATPYGSFEKLMVSAPSDKPNKRVSAQKSHGIGDHYDYPRTKEAVEKEMPKGKRIHPQTMYANPSRVFNSLPESAQLEIRDIHPPDNKAWTSK